eukprot:6148555-Alexandrium_andersonii.AAC.1
MYMHMCTRTKYTPTRRQEHVTDRDGCCLRSMGRHFQCRLGCDTIANRMLSARSSEQRSLVSQPARHTKGFNSESEPQLTSRCH